MTYLLVFLGGGIGCVCRYAIGVGTLRYYHGPFPLGTFLSNVLSCLVLTAIVATVVKFAPNDRYIKAGLMVGFCGGFSTFSTFAFETVQLIKNGNHMVAVLNVIISVAASLILIYKLIR